MPHSFDLEIRSRAHQRCEYCHLPSRFHPAPFHIDHIIARKHGGSSLKNNLAYACFHCNTHKGPNIASLDPATGRLTPLYHPRSDRWTQHFAWQGAFIDGLTPTGRATIQTLVLNLPLLAAVRQALAEEGHAFDAR